MPSIGENIASLAQSRSGSMSLPISSQRLKRTLEFGPNRGELVMLSYVPKSLEPRAGLVVVLHGCTQTAEGYAQGAGWLELADRYGFIVLCPQQQHSNNPNLCFNWFSPEDTARGRGEAASIHDMIQLAITRHDLDPNRVFITGLSAGGAMANVMLANHPELFAAGAIIAGLPVGSASNMVEAFSAMTGKVSHSSRDWGARVRSASKHPGPWPTISVWQGDQDRTVKAEVAEMVASQWADVHGGTKESSTPSRGRRTVQRWRAADGRMVVELNQISSMGHGTPVSCSGSDICGSAGAFLLDVGISSSLELARSWGLASTAPPAEQQASPLPHPTPQHPSNPDHLDIGKVISGALRTAGLMR